MAQLFLRQTGLGPSLADAKPNFGEQRVVGRSTHARIVRADVVYESTDYESHQSEAEMLRRFRLGRMTERHERFGATELGEMLVDRIFDKEEAAQFLGVDPWAVQMACFRHRLPFVQYKQMRLFALGDLVDYASSRGVGRHSRLKTHPHWEVVARQAMRVEH